VADRHPRNDAQARRLATPEASGGGASVDRLFDFPAFDVALGLIFVFVILSLVCSAIMETISSVLAWRADYLKKGLQSLLSEDLMNKVFAHPLVDPLIRSSRDVSPRLKKIPVVRDVARWSRRTRYPSYLPSRTVISALLNLDVKERTEEASATVDDALTQMQKAVDDIKVVRVKNALSLLLVQAREGTDKAEEAVERFRRSAETWYEDTMERVSGWYRRRVQLVLWIVALVVALLLNVDTLNIGSTLWRDDAVRAAVVAQARQAAQEEEPGAVTEDLKELSIPLGWSFDGGASPQDLPSGWESWLGKAIGLVLTAAAVSLGAPFWFDLLGKVARLRSTGVPPPTTAAAGGGSK
jgi:hypothetical protein